MKKKIIIPAAGACVLIVGAFFILGGSKKTEENGLSSVKGTRGEIVEKALAVGTIEPENEVSVKSKVSGVVGKIYADAGAFIEAGQPLLEVRPDPAPLELADAKRQVQLSEVDLVSLARDKPREDSLFSKQLISSKEYDDFQHNYQSAELHVKIARERLALIESGRSRSRTRRSSRSSRPRSTGTS